MAKREKGLCPECGRKGLGHSFPDLKNGGTYRNCTYCGAQVKPEQMEAA